MYATDPELGQQVRVMLEKAQVENPIHKNKPLNAKALIRGKFADIMVHLGLDVMNASIVDTPERVAEMYANEIFYGLDYNNFPKCTTFERELDELIMVDDMELKSMCEHHWMPIIGRCAVGYIPKGKVMGLSKFNRVVNFFSRRPQIQERLVEQISLALQVILDTEDIGVVIRADHYCMKMRGVEDFSASTITSKMAGRFMTVPPLREEFLQLSRVTK